MKNSVKLFGLLAVSLFIFSCSTDEQDAELERAIKMSESIYQREGVDSTKVGDSTNFADSTSVLCIKEEGNPQIVIKRD